MTVRPPKALAPDQESDNPLDDALQQEIMAEKAATYARLVRRLEDALEALRAFDSEAPDTPSPSPPGLSRGSNGRGEERKRGLDARDEPGHDADVTRDQLLNAAGQALWHVIVHRDICGLRRHDLFCKELGVPDAVRLRMGRVTSR